MVQVELQFIEMKSYIDHSRSARPAQPRAEFAISERKVRPVADLPR